MHDIISKKMCAIIMSIHKRIDSTKFQLDSEFINMPFIVCSRIHINISKSSYELSTSLNDQEMRKSETLNPCSFFILATW